ncbi:pyridoxamine 5'-phosphate oxidase family protein [Arenibacter sp. GZD96]|uniref:pyridoxamine 5'-phosphate oxidase family protein n=1 Tax=Aurantibrevibacter litoralis TaxID=3106030 RepID=UPI002AFDD6EA|nr:pyridoxamine 5'-phosphate oxidase family protein [Arenibacter sp. GZD-96]MEA1785679.1 pyridoxamine 5'-phosphate oxidase family protein [Arenibacter sp. GZD-96]
MIKKLEPKEALQLLADNYIGHVSFIANGSPFCLPITYFYDADSKSIISYASDGHKLRSMRKNNNVSLAVDEITSGNQWRSVLAHGVFEELHGSDAKYYLHKFSEGVKSVIAQKDNTHPKFIRDFSISTDLEHIPTVYHIKIEEITGKFRDA